MAARSGLRHRVTDGGTAVFARFPITSTTHITDGGGSRVVQIVGTPIAPVTVYALHPAPGYEGQQWTADHRRIERAIRAAPTVRSIAAGDLNATPDNAPLRRSADGFTDAAMQTRSGWHPTLPPMGVTG